MTHTIRGIRKYLEDRGALITHSHLVLTSGMHSTSYINMRAVANDAPWFDDMGWHLANELDVLEPDLVIGPETLGRDLARFTASNLREHNEVHGIWCDIVEEKGVKYAKFSPKMNFKSLVPGKRVVIVDDLLSTGLSISLVAELIQLHEGEVVGASVAVRRNQQITADACNVPELTWLCDIEDFDMFTEEECQQVGPCSYRTPMLLRPGHGHEWIKYHPDYPQAIHVPA